MTAFYGNHTRKRGWGDGDGKKGRSLEITTILSVNENIGLYAFNRHLGKPVA